MASTSRGLRLQPYHNDDVKHLPDSLRDASYGWTGVAFPRTPHSFPVYPDLRNKDLRGRDLRGYDLTGGDFGGANMEGMDLRKADFRGAYMRGANLKNANLEGANLSAADLKGANLARTDLKKAYLRMSDLTDADFTDAYMRNTTLTGSVLHNTRFDGADMQKSASDWDKQSKPSHRYAADMRSLASYEHSLAQEKDKVKELDQPGKRNSMLAKLARREADWLQGRITNLRFEWRHLLATDPDSRQPSKIAERLAKTLPPQLTFKQQVGRKLRGAAKARFMPKRAKRTTASKTRNSILTQESINKPRR